MGLNIDEIKAGKLLQIEADEHPHNNGTWKVEKVERSVLEPEGEFPCIRITLSRHMEPDKEEIYLEIYPEIDDETIFILQTFDAFSIAEAKQWPPPRKITMGEDKDIIFRSCDIDTVQKDEDHGGYDRTSDDGREFTHWEYQSDMREILQVVLEDNWVTMYIGYQSDISTIKLT